MVRLLIDSMCDMPEAFQKHPRVDMIPLNAVSYTHLDVYKRQTPSGPRTAPWGVDTIQYWMNICNYNPGAPIDNLDGKETCLLYTSSYRYMKKAESVQSGMKAAVLTSISKIKTGNMCFVAA